jgi:hypothetical protein
MSTYITNELINLTRIYISYDEKLISCNQSNFELIKII